MIEARKWWKHFKYVIVAYIAILSLASCVKTRPLLQGRRAIFPLSRFDPGQPNVEEVWFLGSHTDIGGGYRKRGLADYSLRWMIDKANKHGLDIKETPIVGDTAMHIAEFNDSSSFCCSVASFFKKGRIHIDRTSRVDDIFHWSSYDERMQFQSVKPRLPPETMMAYTSRSYESRVAIV